MAARCYGGRSFCSIATNAVSFLCRTILRTWCFGASYRMKPVRVQDGALPVTLAQEPSRRAVDEMQFRACRAYDGHVSASRLGIAGDGSQPMLHIHAGLGASEKEGTVHVLNMAVAGPRETTDVYVGQSPATSIRRLLPSMAGGAVPFEGAGQLRLIALSKRPARAGELPAGTLRPTGSCPCPAPEAPGRSDRKGPARRRRGRRRCTAG
jgi:hypothetical protein